MKENLEIAIDFTRKAKKVKGVLQVILFGSVSTGMDTARSDIDIGVVFDDVNNKFKLAKEINKFKHERIQLTLIELKDLANETELTGALSGEGLLLYGRPINIESNKIKLQPKILISYSLNNIPQAEKVKLNRALHGSISKSEFRGSIYRTETKGLTNEPGIDKINRGVLLVDRIKSTKVINVLKRFKAEVKEIAVWGY